MVGDGGNVLEDKLPRLRLAGPALARQDDRLVLAWVEINKATKSKYTANEGPVIIQYKCLVSFDVFPEMKLLFPKQNYNLLSPSSYTQISLRDLYIYRISLPILLQGNMWTDPGNI